MFNKFLLGEIGMPPDTYDSRQLSISLHIYSTEVL